ncbi:MAG: oligoendopeptidase F [Candidatus Palauibacterales bacterium]|nr:oligoendopeptidase F [Candidatus Palauibacterales bacterium]
MTAEGDRHEWNLEDIYPDLEAWDAALTGIQDGIESLRDLAGTLDSGPSALLHCLDLHVTVLKAMYRASSYASMKYHEDTRVGATAGMEQRVGLIATQLSEAASYIEPEILSIGRETVNRYLEAEPELRSYAHQLDDILRRAEHTRSASEEEIIAAAGLVTEVPSTGYAMLANADAPWPRVTLSTGTEFLLNQAGYSRYRSTADRDDRELVFREFFSVWQQFRRTLGTLLYAQVKRDVFYARVRKYDSSLDASLDADRIPPSVYRTLIEQANEHLHVLHRYFGLRARMMGLDQMRYWDIYPPLVRGDDSYPIERGKQLVLDSLAPLGDEARRPIERGFDSRWMDVYPRQGKKSGAYMNGHVYDVHPYVLMNYNDDYESVSTLAHEWGHALHSYLTNETQHFVNADYSIFVAEVASTLNEALLLHRMLDEAADAAGRLFYLGHALEQLRGTFFRQSMFAEFELSIHEKVEAGSALTADEFGKLYGNLLRRYHGHEEGVVHIDDVFEVEWAYIPHFYYNFYVYQYATAVAASSFLAEQILDGRPGAAAAYLDLLRAGGAGYPYDLLVEAGVDLAGPEPYRALMRRMGHIMDEIESLLEEGAA